MKFFMISTLFLVTITAWAQPKKTQPSPPADNQELKQLFAGDMHDRGSEPFQEKGKPVKEWKESPDMSKNDAIRQKRVREMLNEGTVRTANDYVWASFIFQHGQTPDDYLLAHVLGMIAASKGDKMGRWIAAATLDRYLQSIRQAQVRHAVRARCKRRDDAGRVQERTVEQQHSRGDVCASLRKAGGASKAGAEAAGDSRLQHRAVSVSMRLRPASNPDASW